MALRDQTVVFLYRRGIVGSAGKRNVEVCIYVPSRTGHDRRYAFTWIRGFPEGYSV